MEKIITKKGKKKKIYIYIYIYIKEKINNPQKVEQLVKGEKISKVKSKTEAQKVIINTMLNINLFFFSKKYKFF